MITEAKLHVLSFLSLEYVLRLIYLKGRKRKSHQLVHSTGTKDWRWGQMEARRLKLHPGPSGGHRGPSI